MAPAARIEGRELCKNRHVIRSSPHLLLRIKIMEFFAGRGWDVGELLAVGRHCPRPTQHHGKGALPLPPYLCEIIPNTWSQGIYILDLMLKSFQIDQGHTQLCLCNSFLSPGVRLHFLPISTPNIRCGCHYFHQIPVSSF